MSFEEMNKELQCKNLAVSLYRYRQTGDLESSEEGLDDSFGKLKEYSIV